jgi:hypothetical protein
MHEPVDGRQRHGLVGENLAPFAEGLVGRDKQRSAFIAGGDQLEQNTGLGLILGRESRRPTPPRWSRRRTSVPEPRDGSAGEVKSRPRRSGVRRRGLLLIAQTTRGIGEACATR